MQHLRNAGLAQGTMLNPISEPNPKSRISQALHAGYADVDQAKLLRALRLVVPADTVTVCVVTASLGGM